MHFRGVQYPHLSSIVAYRQKHRQLKINGAAQLRLKCFENYSYISVWLSVAYFEMGVLSVDPELPIIFKHIIADSMFQSAP